MKRALSVLLAAGLAGAASATPRPAGTDAEAARRWIHPMTVTDVYYSFEVETEGLPKHMYEPPPRDIDVTYRDLDTGRLVTERDVDADWGLIFRNPTFTRGRVEAVARAGGRMWCILEINHHDGSGWVVSESGRRRCRVKRAF